MTMRALREAVLRDLSWLLNAGSRPLSDEIWDYPLVAKSVINFGMPDMAGLTTASVGAEALEEMVLAAIRAFEPRVVGRTLGVRAVETSEQDGQTVVSIEIAGDILPLPMPEALLLRTSLDLETGRCELSEGKGA
jgi:type VI secretion system protein ImpF